MSDKLNIQDIVDLLVANSDISKEEAEIFMVELFSLIEKGLATDELTKIKDFGTFKLTHIEERESVDVNSKERIVIPAHRRVTFTPCQLLKDLVNKPFAHFETTPLNEGVFMDGIPTTSSDNDEDDDRIDDAEDKTKEDEPIGEIAETTTNKIAPEATTEDKEPQEDEEIEQKEEEDKVEQEEELLPPIVVSTSTHSESTEKVPPSKESPTDDDNQESLKEKTEVDTTIHHLEVKPDSKEKRRYNTLWWNVAIGLVAILITVGFVYNRYSTNKNSASKQKEEPSNPTQPTANLADAHTDTIKDELVAIVDPVETVEALPRKKVKMSPDRTLRLIALEKFGNKEFWVYIYMINKDIINNPNIVPVGLVLELPHENEYPMDANNPEEVAKAKKLGDEVIKGFG